MVTEDGVCRVALALAGAPRLRTGARLDAERDG